MDTDHNWDHRRDCVRRYVLIAFCQPPDVESSQFPVFSALRAYALSNRSIILAVAIVLLALPPTVIRIVSLPG